MRLKCGSLHAWQIVSLRHMPLVLSSGCRAGGLGSFQPNCLPCSQPRSLPKIPAEVYPIGPSENRWRPPGGLAESLPPPSCVPIQTPAIGSGAFSSGPSSLAGTPRMQLWKHSSSSVTKQNPRPWDMSNPHGTVPEGTWSPRIIPETSCRHVGKAGRGRRTHL